MSELYEKASAEITTVNPTTLLDPRNANDEYLAEIIGDFTKDAAKLILFLLR